jgi:hypothetical protein
MQSVKDRLAVTEMPLADTAARNLRLFLDDLPGDLNIGLRQWLVQNGLRALLNRVQESANGK